MVVSTAVGSLLLLRPGLLNFGLSHDWVCYFHYFGSSHVSLIGIWLLVVVKFNPKLTLRDSKIDHFPHLRIHLLYKNSWSDWLLRDPDLILTWSDVLSDSFDWMDLLLDSCLIITQFVPISFVSIHTQCFNLIPVECLVFTIVLKHAEALICCQCLIS